MNKTKIDWCDSTWNPVTGCLHGCEYCYARGIAERFGGKQKYANIFEESEPVIGEDGKALAYPHSFSPTFLRYRLNDYAGKQGRNIFVCSMADLFGDWVPDSWIEEVFKACEKAPQHNYLFLTKNVKRYTDDKTYQVLLKYALINAWFGTTVTTQSELNCRTLKLPLYKNCFLSIEPILEKINIEEIDIATSPIKWIIVGAETGRRKDKVIPKREWIERLVYYCGKWGIPLFMKSSLADIWDEPLMQEFPEGLKR